MAQKLESYSKIRLLGEGTFGKAYLVQAQSDKQKCVIKQMDIRTMTEEEKRDTLREAKILECLNHPNIIRFREVYKTKKGKLCIVMDFADGGDLHSKIKDAKGSYFPENQILDWFVQFCLALKHVHDRKILHRDLKSQNIFLNKNGIVKLGDFGIARVLNNTKENAKTVVGTPYYLSPEIVENRPYSFKSDIWSLGVLLYELCTLKPPFDASSLHFLALKIVRGVFPPIPSHYSRELKSLVATLLNTDPNKRPNINQILSLPIVRSRIKHFLDESTRENEFSHTILHNQHILDSKNKMSGGSGSSSSSSAASTSASSKSTAESDPRKKMMVVDSSPAKFSNPENKPSREELKKKLLEEQRRLDEERTRSAADRQNRRNQDRAERDARLNRVAEESKKNHEEDRKRIKDDIQNRRDMMSEHLRKNPSTNSGLEETKSTSTSEDLSNRVVSIGEDREDDQLDEGEEDRNDKEAEDKYNKTQEEGKVYHTISADYSKLEALRMYLEEKLGEETLVEAYQIVKQMDESGSDSDYARPLQHLMDVDRVQEFVPLIQTLIYMESPQR